MTEKVIDLVKSVRMMLDAYTEEDEVHWAKLNGYEPKNFAGELLKAAKESDEMAEQVLSTLVEARISLEEESNG